MNVLSCFDGMGCARIALDRLGIPVNNYYAAEIDKYAMQIAAKNYPDIQHVGDITKLNASDFEEPIDLIIGGSPCQGFSFAGKQLNFDDPRSKLFFEFVWLYYELKPKYFLLENVRMKKECQDVISKYLGVEPIAINSSLVSAQNRHRLYWTNLPFNKLPEDKRIMLQDVLLDDATEPMLSNIYGGFGEKKPRLHYGKSVTIRTSAGGGHIPSVTIKDGIRQLDPVEVERLQTVPDNYTEGVSKTQRLRMLGNGFTVDVICHLLRGLKQPLSFTMEHRHQNYHQLALV